MLCKLTPEGKRERLMRWLMLLVLFLGGCATDVKTTDDSTEVKVDLPKVQVGDKKPDLDPRTDDDIDVDTPLPGDK